VAGFLLFYCLSDLRNLLSLALAYPILPFRLRLCKGDEYHVTIIALCRITGIGKTIPASKILKEGEVGLPICRTIIFL